MMRLIRQTALALPDLSAKNCGRDSKSRLGNTRERLAANSNFSWLKIAY